MLSGRWYDCVDVYAEVGRAVLYVVCGEAILVATSRACEAFDVAVALTEGYCVVDQLEDV